MNWNNFIRQTHRWLSVVFTVTVITNIAVRPWSEPPAWITYSPLPPLFIQLLTGFICSCCRTLQNRGATVTAAHRAASVRSLDVGRMCFGLNGCMKSRALERKQRFRQDEAMARVVHLKGQVSLDQNGEAVCANEMRAQARNVLESIRDVLGAMGGQMCDIVLLVHYAVDIEQFMVTGDIRRVVFHSSVSRHHHGRSPAAISSRTDDRDNRCRRDTPRSFPASDERKVSRREYGDTIRNSPSNAIRHCEELLRRSNPGAACCSPWIASLRSQ